MEMEELRSLGLTENEILVYLSALRQKSSSIQSLVLNSGVKRTTIYSCLEKLKRLGLVTEGEENKKKVFLAEEPEKFQESFTQEEELFQERIKQKRKILRNLIPQLKALSKKSVKAPKLRYYEGLTGLWNMADDFLKEKKDSFELGSTIKGFNSLGL